MILCGGAAPMACLAAVSPVTARASTSVASRLRGGFEIKTAFAGFGGDAHIILQRGTSADMRHSAPQQTCEN